MDISKIIRQFNNWYISDPHRKNINYYDKIITYANLKSLSHKKLIKFFKEFLNEGGRVQSGGKRNKNNFEKYLCSNINSFREFILEPFSCKFDLEHWFDRIKDHKYFGVGTATIYLNRVDRNIHSILNNKTLDALRTLDYNISKTINFSNYLIVKNIQKKWIESEPLIDNYYKADALNHFIIGTESGINLIRKLKSQDLIEANYEQDKLSQLIDDDVVKDKDLLEHIRKNENESSEYIIIKSKKFKRSNYLMALIKRHRGFKCQFCNETILKEDGSFYIEACHINAKADGGKDVLENILVLCPNHHKLFDFGEKIIITHDNKICVVKINRKRFEANLS